MQISNYKLPSKRYRIVFIANGDHQKAYRVRNMLASEGIHDTEVMWVESRFLKESPVRVGKVWFVVVGYRREKTALRFIEEFEKPESCERCGKVVARRRGGKGHVRHTKPMSIAICRKVNR